MRELFALNKEIRDFADVIIYGAGNAGKAVFLKLLQRDIKVLCFADSDPEKCGKTHLNIPVVHIDDLTERRDAAVIVCGAYMFPVERELRKRGFHNLFHDCANEAGILHLERDEAS
ncbi:MAG: hypothetical protein LBK56_06910 [Gracilibacteraceae bacterium]|jgi:NADH/NAD ratio-sensing transcriptional regulator Rex|nr:hypothetical protein [Gracilibacteraceae bacterium]